MGNCDPYSDSPEPMVLDKPQCTRVEGADVVMQSNGCGKALVRHLTLTGPLSLKYS